MVYLGMSFILMYIKKKYVLIQESFINLVMGIFVNG